MKTEQRGNIKTDRKKNKNTKHNREKIKRQREMIFLYIHGEDHISRACLQNTQHTHSNVSTFMPKYGFTRDYHYRVRDALRRSNANMLSSPQMCLMCPLL